MELHERLYSLAQELGGEVFDDANSFRGALDDFMGEGEASGGEINLLVDAVRFGAYARMLSFIGYGAEPVAAVEAAGDLLSRERGGTDVAGSRWACAVIGYAAGRVSAADVQRYRTILAESAAQQPAGAPPFVSPQGGPPIEHPHDPDSTIAGPVGQVSVEGPGAADDTPSGSVGRLPSGTVTLLFSDIEGSMKLLARLGVEYAAALAGQREVLRAAWVAHGGIELGTGGDGFFVVFPTAEGAVAAAAQAQRRLASHEWPAGERVRVRIGIHTGSPQVHDGGYVGMDVHRAARIAGSAHGGQVVVSQATAHLVEASLPDGVRLVDLGSHRLKDIASAERLFQVAIGGLDDDFAPLKTLGAASSLPRPATALVGRDGELAELTALVSSDVRLVTLTGPGGSGKTRLAIGLAQQLVERFPDGVYYVPLAAVTATDVMWTTIGEVLDVPPEGRMPPGFFEHVAHRSALFVLDNLEQLAGADGVVADLLGAAPQVVVVATSRRHLDLPGEVQHAVPALELPASSGLLDALGCGAVQLFVQHARAVRSTFTLTAANVGDVVEVCRRLDGLPLGIELAAARVRLLSPKAVLARLDQVLDIAATGTIGRPSRQQTLRETIAWSYDLLDEAHRSLFRRLGVFGGGADLDAIAEVVGDLADADPFDVVADLVDASLVTVAEDAQGEPRFAMLETIRAYAQDQLEACGDEDEVRRRHAQHYLSIVQETAPVLDVADDRLAAVRGRLTVEHDNFREALTWACSIGRAETTSQSQAQVGLRLAAALSRFWEDGGYLAEGSRWLDQAISAAADQDSPELARSLNASASFAALQGDIGGFVEAATRSVAMCRRLADTDSVAAALQQLSHSQMMADDFPSARQSIEEAVVLAGEATNKDRLASSLLSLGDLEAFEHDWDRSIEHLDEAIRIFAETGNVRRVLLSSHNKACTLREMGLVKDAQQLMRQQIPEILRVADQMMLIVVAEDYAAVLAELGDPERAARLLGAADAMRERNGAPRDPGQQAEIDQPIAKARTALSAQDWATEYQRGLDLTVEAALDEAHTAPTD